ncbi:MAG: EpsD family peptidyl-prolyl cis-trans isomerase [Rhodocyclaceae bacterium]|nr:EpsD family peptidyl-prolyl cis-trans isomerase [Rhodocyclaceae bacterium]
MTKDMLSNSRTAAILVAVAISVGVAGCGEKKKDEKKHATQVAAKVDGEEISVHQINNVMAKTPGIPQERAEEARREILNKLVDQQIAVNKAAEQKLDRNPEVMMAIESARREIIARAYLEKFAAGLPKPTPDEIKAYYNEHPELFSQRRIYNVQEISIQPQEGLLAAVQEKVSTAKNLEEVAAWLKGRNAKFAVNAGARAAEQIPLDILPKLHETKDGQTLVMGTPQAILVIRVAASRSAAVDEKTATPRITQFLSNKRASEAIAAEMKQLKDKAKIEFVGDFAKPPATDAAKAPGAPAKDAAAPAGTEVPKSALEKGAAGLK